MSNSEIHYCYNITYRYWIFMGHSNVNNVIVVCITGILQNTLPIPNNLHCSIVLFLNIKWGHTRKDRYEVFGSYVKLTLFYCVEKSVIFCALMYCIDYTYFIYIILSVFYFVLFLYYSPSSESVTGDRLWHSTLNRKRSC